MAENRIGMSIDEASAYTGIGRNTMRQLIEWQKLPVLRIGRKIVIRRDALERFVALNEGRNLRNRSEVRTTPFGNQTEVVIYLHANRLYHMHI